MENGDSSGGMGGEPRIDTEVVFINEGNLYQWIEFVCEFFDGVFICLRFEHGE